MGGVWWAGGRVDGWTRGRTDAWTRGRVDGWAKLIYERMDAPRQHLAYIEHAYLQLARVRLLLHHAFDEEDHDHAGQSQQDRKDTRHLRTRVTWRGLGTFVIKILN